MKKSLHIVAASYLATLLVHPALSHAAIPTISGDALVDGILSTILYGAIGMVMATLSFKVLDLVTPGDLKKQLCDDKNIALGLVVGLQGLGVCIIIAAAIAG
jgi:putative membrane protein